MLDTPLPAPHWKITVGNLHLTRATLFRVCLLVGCDGLETRLGSERGPLEVQLEIPHAKSAVRELRMQSILSLLAPVEDRRRLLKNSYVHR